MQGPREVGQHVLIVQIDGLSRPALERFMREGRTPSLRRLAMRSDMRMSSVFAGVPSTTAVAQAELFYGVRQAVPAFLFLENRSVVRRMIEPMSASAVQSRVEGRGANLLAGGAAYGDIYSGGAVVTRYCPVGVARREFHSVGDLFRSVAMYGVATLRAVGMLVGEGGRLVVGGRTAAGPVSQRMIDARDRIVASVVVRDSTTRATERDIRVGRPIVHLNYFGYDKQAHRYGPESVPARRALQGIDRAIGRLVRTAELSGPRRWLVLVHSDHGQERVTPLLEVGGRSIEAIVKDVAGDRGFRPEGVRSLQSGALCHVYLDPSPDCEGREAVAAALAREIGSGGAMARGRDGPMLWHGRWAPIPVRDASGLLDVDHPFAEAALGDLEALASHPEAGDVVLLATGIGGRSITFEAEHGSHGGPGALETHAFALLPTEVHGRMEPAGEPLRLAHIREALLELRGHGAPA